MALALRTAAPLKPEILLAQCISVFESGLTPQQKRRFGDMRKAALDRAPSVEDVMFITAEINSQIRHKSPIARCHGTRFMNVLQCVQRYAALGDVVVGGSQNIVACGIWAIIRMTIQLCIGVGSYLEKISHFFMIVGQSAPRYEQMALLYQRSQRLQNSLSQYFIVIVDTCHQFVAFTQKSLLGQIASSIDSSKMTDAQSNLKRWSGSIQKEINFLLSETMEREANKNQKHRTLVEKQHTWENQERTIRQRFELLSALSNIQHETPYRQARKVGTSTVFQRQEVYKSWKWAIESATLVLVGKLGSGKSVTMASVVDDLLLSDDCIVTYFFCRHDRGNELTSRAVIGSLARQIVTRFFTDSLLDNIKDRTYRNMTLEEVVELSVTTVPPDSRIHFILDGLDECPEDEASEILAVLKDLQSRIKLLLFFSVRKGAGHHSKMMYATKKPEIIQIPDDNPDIATYVNHELQRRIESRQLILGDETIILEIQEALVHGADGMFLWVALQINYLCEETSDADIREALKDLPPDLYTTFTRLLQRSRRFGKSYQNRVLKLITAAYQPLTIDEFREAVSVDPGNTKWNQSMLVNNVYAVLASCGSLVIVDEDNLLVHLIHKSFSQFLLTKPTEFYENDVDGSYHFTSGEAQRYMAECIITYLNFSVLETRVSTRVAPKIQLGSLHNHVMKEALEPSGIAGKLALLLLQSTARPSTFDTSQILLDAESKNRELSTETPIIGFFAYVSRFWIQHTTCIEKGSHFYQLLIEVFDNTKFDHFLWKNSSVSPQHDHIRSPNHIMPWYYAQKIATAILSGHMTLFHHEIRGKKGLKAICAVVPFLKSCLLHHPRPVISPGICTILFDYVSLFDECSVLDWLISMGASQGDRPRTFLNTDTSSKEYRIIKSILSQQNSKGQHAYLVRPSLAKQAIKLRDSQMINRIRKHQRNFDLEWVFTSDLEDPSIIKAIYYVLQEDFRFRHCSVNKIFEYLQNFRPSVNHLVFNPLVAIISAAKRSLPTKKYLIGVKNAMEQASFSGDLDMVYGLMTLPSGDLGEVDVASSICAALHCRPHISMEIAEILLHGSNRPSTSTRREKTVKPEILSGSLPPLQNKKQVLLACLQLHRWAIAEKVFNSGNPNVNERLDQLQQIRTCAMDFDLLNSCVSSLDVTGVEFLKKFAWTQVATRNGSDSSGLSTQSPLERALETNFDTWESFLSLLNMVQTLVRCDILESPRLFDALSTMLGNVQGLLQKFDFTHETSARAGGESLGKILLTIQSNLARIFQCQHREEETLLELFFRLVLSYLIEFELVEIFSSMVRSELLEHSSRTNRFYQFMNLLKSHTQRPTTELLRLYRDCGHGLRDETLLRFRGFFYTYEDVDKWPIEREINPGLLGYISDQSLPDDDDSNA